MHSVTWSRSAPPGRSDCPNNDDHYDHDNRDMCLFNVDGGQRAVIFDRFQGVKEAVVGEGTHFMIPVVQKPIIIDVRARPRTINSITGTKDLQMANISLRCCSCASRIISSSSFSHEGFIIFF